MRMINQYKNNVSLLNSACISLFSVRRSCFRLLSAIGLLSGFIITPITGRNEAIIVEFKKLFFLNDTFITFTLTGVLILRFLTITKNDVISRL